MPSIFAARYRCRWPPQFDQGGQQLVNGDLSSVLAKRDYRRQDRFIKTGGVLVDRRRHG